MIKPYIIKGEQQKYWLSSSTENKRHKTTKKMIQYKNK